MKELKRELNNDFVRKTQSKNMKLIPSQLKEKLLMEVKSSLEVIYYIYYQLCFWQLKQPKADRKDKCNGEVLLELSHKTSKER